MALFLAAPAADAAGPDEGPGEDPGPLEDPNDAPFMKPPNGQLGTWSGEPEPLTRGFSSQRRLQLTALPSYAAIRLPLFGRGSGCDGGFDCSPVRGVGASVELDVRVVRWLWLRLGVGHTVHPVKQNISVDDETEEVTVIANPGVIGATTFGLSGVYPLDLGRFLPLLDFGVGGMILTSPPPAISGQMGAQCRDGGVCDVGLSCGPDNTCRQTIVPEAHVGVGLDILLGRHWSLGFQVRYYALLSAVSVFPTYLLGAARLAARF